MRNVICSLNGKSWVSVYCINRIWIWYCTRTPMCSQVALRANTTHSCGDIHLVKWRRSSFKPLPSSFVSRILELWVDLKEAISQHWIKRGKVVSSLCERYVYSNFSLSFIICTTNYNRNWLINLTNLKMYFDTVQKWAETPYYNVQMSSG